MAPAVKPYRPGPFFIDDTKEAETSLNGRRTTTMFKGRNIQTIVIYHPGGNFLYRVGEEGIVSINLSPPDLPGQNGWFLLRRKGDTDMYVNSRYVVESTLSPEETK
jgi:hypothetical protein